MLRPQPLREEKFGMKQYGKFIAQVVFAVLTAIVAALADDRVDVAEGINAAIVGFGAIAVLGAGNLPSGVWAYTKTIVSAATAALTLLVSFLSDGGHISTAEWVQVALAAAAAVGVYFAPAPRVYDADTYGQHAAGLRPGPA
jgi:hypothetical protein